MITPGLAITRPQLYEPELQLPNKWFVDAGTLTGREVRAFEKVSGITSRLIAAVDEREMSLRAISKVQSELGVDLRNCVGLVVASSSMSYDDTRDPVVALDPGSPADALFSRWPSVTQLTQELRDFVNPSISPDLTYGINWGCSAYTKALEICLEMGLRRGLGPKEFFLVVTTNCLSRRMDYRDRISTVFGDCATATVVRSSTDCDPRSTLHVLAAKATMFPIPNIPFTCEAREAPLRPTPEQGRTVGPPGVCILMDGQAVKDQAPRVLFRQAKAGLELLDLPNACVRDWLPHQAGSAITNIFAAELTAAGIGGKAVHSIGKFGNLSSSSIPSQLHYTLDGLIGVVGCPSVGASVPGRREMSQGYVFLERRA